MISYTIVNVTNMNYLLLAYIVISVIAQHSMSGGGPSLGMHRNFGHEVGEEPTNR
jgi:hypothetical protein